MNKKELRQYMRSLKERYTVEELRAMSESLTSRVRNINKVKDAATILLYHSLPDEVFTHILVDDMVAMGKRVILPKVVSETDMTFHEYRSPGDLTLGSYGILEPCTAPIPIKELCREVTVGVIPGMAFDRYGHRLGRGKGYYDRQLALLPDMYRIGLCFPFQFLDSIPSDEHDIMMDEVIGSIE